MILCCRGCLHCRTLGSTLGLYSLEARSTPQSCQSKMSVDIVKWPLKAKLRPPLPSWRPPPYSEIWPVLKYPKWLLSTVSNRTQGSYRTSAQKRPFDVTVWIPWGMGRYDSARVTGMQTTVRVWEKERGMIFFLSRNWHFSATWHEGRDVGWYLAGFSVLMKGMLNKQKCIYLFNLGLLFPFKIETAEHVWR